MKRLVPALLLCVVVVAAVRTAGADDQPGTGYAGGQAAQVLPGATGAPHVADTPREKALAKAARTANEGIFSGSVENGWDLFRVKGCLRCHAVWGQGGDSGPDLGRTGALNHMNAGQLAGIMWNHVPRMRAKMEEEGLRLPPIAPGEMNDLFALLLFIRHADEPGDADEGERILTEHHCDECHSIDKGVDMMGPDLGEWARFVNPVVWAQKMLAHAPKMKDAMMEMDVEWPEFRGSDLVNIVAYIRSEATGESKVYLKPGSIERGRQVFQERACDSCHTLGEEGGVGPDLQTIDLPDTLAGVASQMWNHAPEMLQEVNKRADEKSTSMESLEAQEMADVITFVLAVRYFLPEGNAERGARIFVMKQCVACHGINGWGGSVGPRLDGIAGNASAVFMAHAMWRYGSEMLTQMAERGIPWPRFDGSEMTDLIAFLNEETRPAPDAIHPSGRTK